MAIRYKTEWPFHRPVRQHRFIIKTGALLSIYYPKKKKKIREKESR